MTLLFCLHCINHSSTRRRNFLFFLPVPLSSRVDLFRTLFTWRLFYFYLSLYQTGAFFISRFVKNVYFYHIADVAVGGRERYAFKTYFSRLKLVYIYGTYIYLNIGDRQRRVCVTRYARSG